MHKTGQSGCFLDRSLGPLLKSALPLMKNVLKPLAKSVLILSGLTAAASATDAAIHKKMFGYSMTTLIISNKEINYIVKIVKSLEKSDLWIKGISETIKNEAKEQKLWYLLLATLGASLLGNLLIAKGKIKVGEGMIRAGQDF